MVAAVADSEGTSPPHMVILGLGFVVLCGAGVAALMGHALAGGAAVVGVALGVGNLYLVRRLPLKVSFALFGLLRLVALAAVVVAGGALLGWRRAPLIAAGIAVVQLVGAASAFRQMRQLQ